MFSVYPVPQYFGQGFTSSAYRVDLYTYQSCVSLYSLSKKENSCIVHLIQTKVNLWIFEKLCKIGPGTDWPEA
jgi:hypothetical protein